MKNRQRRARKDARYSFGTILAIFLLILLIPIIILVASVIKTNREIPDQSSAHVTEQTIARQ